MPRILQKSLIGFACEVRSCDEKKLISPTPASEPWREHVAELEKLVADGWVLVMNHRIRFYCLSHNDRAKKCTCKTNPGYKHLCVKHGKWAADAIWSAVRTPEEVERRLMREGALR